MTITDLHTGGTTDGPTADLVESGHQPKYPFPVAELAAAWDLGRWQAVNWLHAGKNDHGELVTEAGRFFLRRSYRSKTIEALRWQIDLLDQLRHRGLPVPVHLPDRTGDPVVVIDDRLFVLTKPLPGTPFDPNEPFQLTSMGRMLATYHGSVAHLGVIDPNPEPELLLGAVQERLADLDPAALPELHHRGRAIVARLAALWPQLPQTVLHGGCRRGSMLFNGAAITGLLDFDSARGGPRCLDLATAAHDVGKVYTSHGAEDHKVALDLDKIAVFLAGYREIGEITPAEAEAIPVLIEAKRVKRAMGRAERLHAGEPLSDNDRTKIRMEFARLTWLTENAGAMRAICTG